MNAAEAEHLQSRMGCLQTLCRTFCHEKRPRWPLFHQGGRMITLGIARPASAAALLLSCAAACLAQSTTAQITGRISDQSGALVPAAAITVANVNTGITSSTESNELGNYSVPLLPPGTYRITAQKEGFKPRTQTGVELQVNQTARVDFVMELGTLAEAVEVVAAAPLLAQQTSSLGQVVDNTKIVNMPLNGRSPFRLVQLTPGVLSSPAASGQFGDVAVNTNQDSDFSINGGQAHHAEVQIDGVPATAGFNDSLTTIPSVDATQEFKVESNNLSAEWGRFSGGVVNVSTRSGTNDLHGSLYEFLRNSALDANAFFNNRAGQQKPPFRMNQFGFAAGGPVWLGRLYNGRNRTFFFADYQGTRWRRGDVFITTLPAELERAGNFTQSFDQQRRMIRIYDPLTTRLDPNRPGQYIRDPFPGNVIPSSRIDPVAQKISTYYPTPNTPGDPVTHVNNFVSNASRLI
ncbi:MAG: carboxypeptidase regulatory-like domain-containing protein, partial [Acidobacteria bacterium]|nr:carboxypeptidase regulatory-like domain-containing protein [Acidobacteriota bacterium]